jgi:hypothetical protein
LGPYTTVFQAEIYAIGACVHENLRRGYLGKRIHILSDSQPALKAVAFSLPGHRGIAGNEKADALAREKGLQTHLLGLNQYLESPKPLPVGLFLHGSNYTARYIGPTWQDTDRAS